MPQPDSRPSSAAPTNPWKLAAESMARFSRTLHLSRELQRLHQRAESFATPRWQRPYWRFLVRLKRREIARNAGASS